ncbi:MAG: tRNA (N6-threonylcarbamoyladenosine(37)-N6)-methyltransferase TrmO [Anaerolineales bacterium]|nr:tRNA (N6-threonylcarbamoyladenosine(37)-N6)-methyltransferase TrmO [Anaerolineales bacterium]
MPAEVHLRFDWGHNERARLQKDKFCEMLRRRAIPCEGYSNGVQFAGSREMVFNILEDELPEGDGAGSSLAFAVQLAGHPAESKPLVMIPIGVVHSPFAAPVDVDSLLQVEAEIELDPALTDATQGMVVGDRYQVLFCFHRSGQFDLLQHPRGDRSRTKRGVFALRSPHRPNGIGMTEVVLLAVEGKRLRVSGLDAIEGTPVLDIKPVSHGTSLS